jgi:hypothetical protein
VSLNVTGERERSGQACFRLGILGCKVLRGGLEVWKYPLW